MNCLINLGSTSSVVPKITSVYFKSEYRADLSLSDILLKKRRVFVYIQAVRYIKRTAMLVYGAFRSEYQCRIMMQKKMIRIRDTNNTTDK